MQYTLTETIPVPGSFLVLVIAGIAGAMAVVGGGFLVIVKEPREK